MLPKSLNCTAFKVTRRRRFRSVTSLPVQALEERTLPAGNVLVSLSGSGNLTISGDNLSNAVRVESIDGGIQVVGLNDADGVATTINDQASAVFMGDDFVRGNIKVDMADGADEVFIKNLTINKNVTATMGPGGDVFDILNSRITRNTKVDLGSATTMTEDSLILKNSSFDGNVQVKGTEGTQVVDFSNGNIAKKLTASLGDGDDAVSVLFAGSKTFVANMGSGGDAIDIESSSFDGNMGSAPASLADSVEILAAGTDGNMVIKGTDGTQNVEITNGGPSRKLTVNLGNGDDSLDLTNASSSSLKLHGGGGTDTFLFSPGGSGAIKSKGFEIFD